MTEQQPQPENKTEEMIIGQQYQRAITSFEAIMVSQIDLKKQMADRINLSIRAGVLILALIAFSIFVLLLTLSAQLTRISDVVSSMNTDFTSVSLQMNQMDHYVGNMEKRVAMMPDIEKQTEVMSKEMHLILADLEPMSETINGIRSSVYEVRINIDHLSASMNNMNSSVQRMGVDMHRMGQPARSMNRIFPFP